MSMEDINNMIHEVDVDHSGTINYQGNVNSYLVMCDRVSYGCY